MFELKILCKLSNHPQAIIINHIYAYEHILLPLHLKNKITVLHFSHNLLYCWKMKFMCEK